ncbi:MAG TPA: trypsin-like peptidase domain-containing protein [Aggregatilineales bacterium]|nr:trypsin-like peptidase domain-containing protein [Anaerolineales bacterium]HRE46991.1 trypsin-like peptidase domain-containing protein [Aggregatilineales bacterium]
MNDDNPTPRSSYDAYDHHDPYTEENESHWLEGWDEGYSADSSEPHPRTWLGTMVRFSIGAFTALALASAALFTNIPLTTPSAKGWGETTALSANMRPVEVEGGFASAQVPTPTPVPPFIVSQAEAYQQTLINVFARAESSVVNVEVVTANTFDEADSSGSGFVYDMQGYIITNAHVVRDATRIDVTFRDGYSASAAIIGIDNYSDLAVIQVKIDARHLFPLSLGDSSDLKVGQTVIAIGNPFGLLSSMTTGVISATGRTLNSARMISPRTRTAYQNPSIIQTDAQINPGNSGGPLLNLYGEVIGVNTAIRSETGIFQGIGFAVPVNTVKRVIPQLISKGRADYTWLGITAISPQNTGLSGITVASLAELYALPVDYGVLVSDVVPNSPAARAGLQGGSRTVVIRGVNVTIGGDIIIAINSVPIRDFDQLIGYLVANTSPGDVVTLTLYRGATLVEVDITLEARPAE